MIMTEIWTALTQTGELIGNRLSVATLVVPDLTAWAVCLFLLGIYALVAIPIGMGTGFLQREWVTTGKDLLLIIYK